MILSSRPILLYPIIEPLAWKLRDNFDDSTILTGYRIVELDDDDDDLCTNLVLDNVKTRADHVVVNRFLNNDFEDLVPDMQLEQLPFVQLNEVMELDDDPVMGADLDAINPEMVDNNDLVMNVNDVPQAAIGFRMGLEITEGVEVESSGA